MVMAEATEKEIKGLLSYTEEDLRQGLKKGTYHLQVVEATADYWDADAQTDERFQIKTKVVDGESANQFGPNHSWSFREFVFEGSETTEPFTTSRTDQIEKFVRQAIFAIHGGRELSLTEDTSYSQSMLEEVARQIKGDEFIAVIGEDKNGYAAIKRFYSMDAPPKGYRSLSTKKGFSL